jgi:acetolactate synthase I/III small subunit
MTSSRVRVLSLVCEDHPGVLERVSSQVRRRGFNIHSLSVGPTGGGRARMTLTVDAGFAEVDQVAKQVGKLIEVIEVEDLTDDPIVSREIVMARISPPPGGSLEELAADHGARVLDRADGSLILELTAEPAAVDAFVETLRPLGLEELARSGPVAMRRASSR